MLKLTVRAVLVAAILSASMAVAEGADPVAADPAGPHLQRLASDHRVTEPACSPDGECWVVVQPGNSAQVHLRQVVGDALGPAVPLGIPADQYLAYSRMGCADAFCVVVGTLLVTATNANLGARIVRLVDGVPGPLVDPGWGTSFGAQQISCGPARCNVLASPTGRPASPRSTLGAPPRRWRSG